MEEKENMDQLIFHKEPKCELAKRSSVGHLINAHTPISAQSSNFVVFRLQPVCFLSTS